MTTSDTTTTLLLQLERQRRGEPHLVRASLETFRGFTSFDLRWYRRSATTGDWVPTSAGATVPAANLAELAQAVAEAQRIVAGKVPS